MQTPNLAAEISALEAQLQHHQNLLDQAFSDNLEFAETKAIFHQMKILSDKLETLKKSVASEYNTNPSPPVNSNA